MGPGGLSLTADIFAPENSDGWLVGSDDSFNLSGQVGAIFRGCLLLGFVRVCNF